MVDRGIRVEVSEFGEPILGLESSGECAGADGKDDQVREAAEMLAAFAGLRTAPSKGEPAWDGPAIFAIDPEARDGEPTIAILAQAQKDGTIMLLDIAEVPKELLELEERPWRRLYKLVRHDDLGNEARGEWYAYFLGDERIANGYWRTAGLGEDFAAAVKRLEKYSGPRIYGSPEVR